MTSINPHTTRGTGTILTATIYNADHANHISNAQALNNDKMEGATPPVVDGALAVFDGTGGNALREGSLTESDLSSLGDVQGPVSSTDEGFVLFEGNDGKEIKDSGYTAADAAALRAYTANRVVLASVIESASAPVALVDAATVAVDWAAGINFTLGISANRALGNPTNVKIGTWRRIKITQDATGSRTLSYGANYVFPNGDDPVLTTTANAQDVLYLYADSATRIEAYVLKDMKT